MGARYKRLARALALVCALTPGLAITTASATATAPGHGAHRPARKHRASPRPAPRRPAVSLALARLLRSGAISQTQYAEYATIYSGARRSLARLPGTRRAELGAVLANLEAMAGEDLLVPSRLPAAFLTLKRNWEWWTTRPLLASGQRVDFTGSRLVWEYYPTQGIEIQWLASFGQANGYYLSHQTAALEELLDEAISLATQRAGGIAWEYMFQFDGGKPPWTSGLSQGTALQALARAWSRTHQPRYLQAAQQALGIFKAAPQEGVRLGMPAGAHYLEYTYAPTERIVNGFIQALVGLWEYTRLSGDPQGQQLFDEGDAQARAELPKFDTGAWSMYDQHSESDLNYHDLLAEFLEHLCQRTSSGEPLSPAGPIAGDEIYCTTAQRFREDLKTPPAVELMTHTVHTSERAGVQMKLSKISTVSMKIALGGHSVWSNTATVEGGTPRLLWITPSKPGSYEVAIKAVDLAGNEEATSGSIEVKRALKAKRRRAKAASRPRSRPRIASPARRLPKL